jgi:hypothetical protein
MTALWSRPGNRLDLELAVAFELAALHLTRAHSPRQLDQAISFNLHLWRTVRRLVPVRPELCEREMLSDTADHVATMLVVDASPCPDPRDLAFIAGRNTALARDLAGRAVTERMLAELLEAWNAADPRGRRFERWLTERIGAYGVAD